MEVTQNNTYTETTVVNLLEQFYNDIIYDCHGIEARFNRSEARHELKQIGLPVLEQLAERLPVLFPKDQEIDYDLFLAHIWLITDIRDTYNLPPSPYGKDVPCGDQQVDPWIQYCEKNCMS